MAIDDQTLPERYQLSSEEEEEAERLAAAWAGRSGEKKPPISERDASGFAGQRYYRVWLPDEIYRHIKAMCILSHLRPAQLLLEVLPPVETALELYTRSAAE
jgi:hypothetical protein